MQSQDAKRPRIYEGEGDALMQEEYEQLGEGLILVPDAFPSRDPAPTPHIRIQWGQHLLEDLLQGRYRTLICAVNAQDNSHGIISQLARLLPTSQWDEASITQYARQFAAGGDKTKVLKYDMDMVEVLAILRPIGSRHLSMDDLRTAFKIVVEMLQRKPGRLPSASVSFLGARANQLVDEDGNEPTFESVLRAMYEAGYYGDVYPSPAMWYVSKVGLFARYPFSKALDRMREGGY